MFTYKNRGIRKQRFVVYRSDESPYKNFLLYVEEIKNTNVFYPIKYVYDIPLKYYENLIVYKKKDIKNQNLHTFCEEKKSFYENKDKQIKCFCSYCPSYPIFPLYSHLKYIKGKLFCNDKEKDELILYCLEKTDKTYHGFLIEKSENFYKLNVTLQQFDFNDESLIASNNQSTLERRSYILDEYNSEINDEVFRVKIKFNFEKTNKGGSIEGNYLFVDSDTFKEKVESEDLIIDEDILKDSFIVDPTHVDKIKLQNAETTTLTEQTECDKIRSYPSTYGTPNGSCNYMTKKKCFNHKYTLSPFIRFENIINNREKIFANYFFFFLKKKNNMDFEDSIYNFTNKNKNIFSKYEKIKDEEELDYLLKKKKEKKNDNIEHKYINNNTSLITDIEDKYYIALGKKKNNFLTITSYNNEPLKIKYNKEKTGISISFIHKLSDCSDFYNQSSKTCTIYLSIWNEDDIEKELNIFLKCSKQIVNNIETIKKNIILCKNCEQSTIIKFEPIVDLLITPCHIQISKNNTNNINDIQKKNLRDKTISEENEHTQYYNFSIGDEIDKVSNTYFGEDISDYKNEGGIYYVGDRNSDTIYMDRNKLDSKDYIDLSNNNYNEFYLEETNIYNMLSVEENQEINNEPKINSAFITPLKFNAPKHILDLHINRIELLSEINNYAIDPIQIVNIDNNDNIKQNIAIMFLIWLKENYIHSLIFFFFFFFFFIVPSLNIVKKKMGHKTWFYKLIKIRLLILWSLQDLFIALKKIPYKLYRITKKIIKYIFRFFYKAFLILFQSKDQLIDQMHKENEAQRRLYEKKKKKKKLLYAKKQKKKKALLQNRKKILLKYERNFKRNRGEYVSREFSGTETSTYSEISNITDDGNILDEASDTSTTNNPNTKRNTNNRSTQEIPIKKKNEENKDINQQISEISMA
ncbi:conserved protein, unknown function [Hepatocystis sp. ex Piliocolobus tephrosceles]|nr:conserved protein, unknown function [Hepatocystis sp. ex Piliocolobus tephrosceles]